MSGLNMDQLIEKLLTDSKARTEWLEVAARLEEKYPNEKVKKEDKKKTEPLNVKSRTSDKECCRLNYEDGFSICFTSDGGMFLEYIEPGTEVAATTAKSLKSIAEDSVSVFKCFMKDHLINLEDLMFVVTNVGYLFSREAVNAFERNKKVVAQAEQKTRYITQGNKRAFMAGIICGKLNK